MSYVLQSLTHFGAASSTSGLSGAQLFAIIVVAISLISLWGIYNKAKQPGWAAIIPIYSTIVQLRVIKRPWWWIVLLLVPIVDIFVLIMMAHGLAKAFGKGAGYTILLLVLPFLGYPMLAFSDAKYQPSLLGR